MVDRSATGELAEVSAVFREAYGHVVANLVRVFGDINIAEDAAQDAFVVATQRWPRDGIPPNPAGWIVTTARNLAIDQLRRSARGQDLVRQAELSSPPTVPIEGAAEQEGPVRDDRLRLIFTCCHPALRMEHRVALTLRLLGGLSVEEIARAFLVSESAMAKRLSRTKYKIKAANIAYRVPAEGDLPERLGAVLSVLYLIYNSGTAELIDMAPLRTEAIRLARAVAALMPEEPEAAGLLALMLLNESRVPARNLREEVVLLRDQDRSKWDQAKIQEGHAIVRDCIRRGHPGPYQLQAAIQAVHCNAHTFDSTDWLQIVELYDHLLALMATPVVALNRAIALSETEGPEASLSAIETIGPGLDNYYPLHAARGEALRRLGRRNEARAAYQRAVELATTAADRNHLARQVEDLTT